MEDPDLEWVQIKPKMSEDQWNVYRRPLSLVCTIGLFIIGLTEAIVLLWHRGTWGFQEWIHEVTFYNFWNGTYIVISASILLMLTCALGYYAIVKRSICWLIIVSIKDTDRIPKKSLYLFVKSSKIQSLTNFIQENSVFTAFTYCSSYVYDARTYWDQQETP